MKVEQACRFRTAEGYGITAKTEGFDRSQEKLLAEVFNDSMSPIFPKLGTSILSCAVRGGYAFYSKNTLRTHETREAIFTHSYILAAEDYASMMRTMPQRLLAVPASALMDVQTSGEALEQVEFPCSIYGELSIDELFIKYQLTPARYSRLLMGAYEAMTSNRSLRLYTKVSVEEREQVVRELTYCIAEGLLPVLKGKVTFSSGSDTRMNISILQAGTPIRDGDLVFGVEDDRYTNIQYRDDLSTTCFQALGSIDHAQRRKALQNMEDWLCEVTDIENGLSLILICIAYVCSCDRVLPYELSLSLFRSIAKVAGKSLPLKAANALLTDLVENVIDQDMVSTNFLSNIAEWYLMDSSELFRRQADKALLQASEEVCVALVEAVISMPINQNARELVCVLIQEIPADSPELAEDTKTQIIQWIIREDIAELSDFSDTVLSSYTPGQTTKLARQILSSAAGRSLNGAEITVVARALYLMSPENKIDCFTQEDYVLLDTHLDMFTGDLMKVVVANCLRIRIGFYNQIADQVDMIFQLSRRNSLFRMEMVRTLQAGAQSGQYTLLWEHFLTRTLFTQKTAGERVAEFCWKYNTFLDAAGPFEREATACWTKYVRERLEVEALLESGIQKADEVAKQFLKDAERMRVSEETRQTLKRFVQNEFWGLVTFENIPSSSLKVSFELRVNNVPNARLMYPLMAACGQLISKPNQAQELINLVMYYHLSERELHRMQKLMHQMALRLMEEKGFVSWDLLLLFCWEGGNEFDFELLSSSLIEIEDMLIKRGILIRRSSATDSILLRDKSLRRDLRKNLSLESELASRLADELKAPPSVLAGRNNQGIPSSRNSQSPSSQTKIDTAPKGKAEKKSPGISNPFVEEPASEDKKGFFSKFGFKGK